MHTLISKPFVLRLAAALTVGAAMVASGPASAAKKKMTYEQAFRTCTARVDKTIPKASDHSTDTQRATAGAGCMRKLGFKLKNPADF